MSNVNNKIYYEEHYDMGSVRMCTVIYQSGIIITNIKELED